MLTLLLLFFFSFQEKYEFPVLSSQLVTSGVVMKCKETDEEFTPFALTLQKKRIVTVSILVGYAFT